MQPPDLVYQIALSQIPKIGIKSAKNLVAHLGSFEKVFTSGREKLLKVPGIGSILASSILENRSLEKAKQELAFIQKNDIQTFFYLDDNFPARLKECEDAPLMLFAKGNTSCLDQEKSISIVGTRSASNYGIRQVENLTQSIAERKHQAVIVSGLAYGIDIAAHRAALKNGLPTIAVLAHGLDRIYPGMHFETAQEIMQNGCLVSEFISGKKPDPKNFVKRNRIIAGLSDACIVAESARKGGSLITAELANSYNREVFAFPGRIGDSMSVGCNYLIKTNQAILLEHVEDLEYYLSWDKPDKISRPQQQKLFEDLGINEKSILELLKKEDDLELDIIAHRAKLPVSKVSALLLNLEFDGLVQSLPGKRFCINR